MVQKTADDTTDFHEFNNYPVNPPSLPPICKWLNMLPSAGDSLSRHNGHKFSTFDKDPDVSSQNCAKIYLGAFCYEKCHTTNPNGVYSRGADGTRYGVGVNWRSWKGFNYSLKIISMKIHPKI